MSEQAWISRRRDQDNISTFIEDGVSKEDWPFAIQMPAPPFAFGAIAALVHKEGVSQRIVSCINALAGISDPEAFIRAVRELIEGDEEVACEIGQWKPEYLRGLLARIRAAEIGKETE